MGLHPCNYSLYCLHYFSIIITSITSTISSLTFNSASSDTVQELGTLVARTIVDSSYIEIEASPSIPIPTIGALCLFLTIVLESVKLVTSLENALTFTRVGA